MNATILASDNYRALATSIMGSYNDFTHHWEGAAVVEMNPAYCFWLYLW